MASMVCLKEASLGFDALIVLNYFQQYMAG